MSYISHSGKVKAQIVSAFKDYVMLVGVEATKEISKPQLWEGFSDVRDIVDRGQLRASQKITFISLTGDTLEAEIKYPVEYSAPVHNGAVIRYSNGNVRRIMARPWMKRATQKVSFDKVLRRLSK